MAQYQVIKSRYRSADFHYELIHRKLIGVIEEKDLMPLIDHLLECGLSHSGEPPKNDSGGKRIYNLSAKFETGGYEYSEEKITIEPYKTPDRITEANFNEVCEPFSLEGWVRIEPGHYAEVELLRNLLDGER